MIVNDLLSTESSWWVARVLLDCQRNRREILNETLPYGVQCMYVCECVHILISKAQYSNQEQLVQLTKQASRQSSH